MTTELKDRYLVTKHHGAMACCVGRVQERRKDAEKLARIAGHSKGQFKPAAYVRIWRLVAEKEIGK